MSHIRFDGRVAIVTGAGGGLGRAHALELARLGAKVVVNDLGGSGAGIGASATPAQTVVEEIRAAGGEAIANADSVATRAGGAAIVQAALDAWGRVDVLIHNAGFLRNNRFEDLTDEQIDPLIDVHLKAAFYVGQPAYRAMRAQGYGRMLFTGSSSAMFGHAWQANYAAGKGGLIGLSNVVAIEGSAYGIKSNVLLPNAMSRLADEMNSGHLEIPSFRASFESTDWSAAEGRAEPAFVTPLAVYLVSEASQETHGIYSANSGRYARVRIVAAEGWVAPGKTPASVDDVHAHIGQIGELGDYFEPMTNYEEYTAVAMTARRQGVLPPA